MQSVIIFYSRKTQLNAFLQAVFGKEAEGRNEMFSYKSLQIITTDRPIVSENERVLAVFLDITEDFAETKLSKKSIAIVDSENKNAIKILAKCGVDAVVCGGNKTDTVNFSSITDDTITVCQQRTVKTIDGLKIEPREFPYCYSSPDIKTALISATAKLIINC